MSLKTSGIKELRLKLARLANVPVVANEELGRLALEMRNRAREMAPVDVGNLEKSIKYAYRGTQGAGGRFVKGGGSYEVFIDGSMPVPERDGKTVGDYAWEMHEHLAPFGAYKLGPKSLQKDDGRGIVGGKFLERAGEEMRAKIRAELATVITRYINSLDK